jgi:hypothetical protein
MTTLLLYFSRALNRRSCAFREFVYKKILGAIWLCHQAVSVFGIDDSHKEIGSYPMLAKLREQSATNDTVD